MDIPTTLKKLYSHWETHTSATKTPTDAVLPTELRLFVSERMRIWENRHLGKNPPYTKDKILQKYKFCNVYRELDRQTIEIHTDLKPLLNNFPLWLLNLSFHRFVCNPQTIQKVGKLSFDIKNNNGVYNRLLSLPKPKYGNAYIFPISVIQKSEYPTREGFFCFYLPKVMPTIARMIEGFDDTTVNKALGALLPVFGFNFRFHWTEILIDVAYQFPERINLFKDFHVGPGAEPTAKLFQPNSNPTETVESFVGSRIKNFPYLTYGGNSIELSSENWEGIFCEYRKYKNLKSGKGRIRKFHGKT